MRQNLLIISIFLAVLLRPASAISQTKGWATDPQTTISVLKDAGYSQITVGGFSWFSGCVGSWYQTSFTAFGPTGRWVEGTVCSGIITKGAQIIINAK